MAGKLRVTLRKSPISYTAQARSTVRSLGLHRIGETVELVDNPATRGMVQAVRFLVEAHPVEQPGTAGVTSVGSAPADQRETGA